MLAIRLQRVGRKGHAIYRIVVQEAQRHPLSGRVIAYVGTYDPHTKDTKVQVELAQKYLDNGAQPSPRVIKLLKTASVKLPKWVTESTNKKSKEIRNVEKLRKNRPEGAPEPVKEEPKKKVSEESADTEKAEEVPDTTKEKVDEEPKETVEAENPTKTDEKIEEKESIETKESSEQE